MAEFGEGPLGILLTKRPRGLVVSSFSKPRTEAVPRVGDALCAVNGRQIPNDSTLNDAVAILKGVGRPVLVGFRPATAEELRSERPPEPAHWPVERKPSPPPTSRAQTDLQALASYARSAVETVTEAPPVDHGELPPGLDARPPPPLSTAPVAADGWAVSTLTGRGLVRENECEAAGLCSCALRIEPVVWLCDRWRTPCHVVSRRLPPDWVWVRAVLRFSIDGLGDACQGAHRVFFEGRKWPQVEFQVQGRPAPRLYLCT